MLRPYVLLHQARPSHQILLHQACNALGIFNVRVACDIPDLHACLAREGVVDLLILDPAMARDCALTLLERLEGKARAPAIMFVGSAGDQGRARLAGQARERGLNVVAELAWPLPIRHWQQALKCIQTVTSAPHAH